MTTTDQEPEADASAATGPPHKTKHRLGRRALGLIAMGLAVGILLRVVAVELLVVPTTSMYPTLEPGDRVLVEKITPLIGSIGQGDVVVFDNPLFTEDDPEDHSAMMRALKPIIRLLAPGRASEDDPLLVKRVVAAEGQTVEAREGVLWVDGIRMEEDYIDQGILMRDFGPVTVPSETVFVLGDKRNYSTDSRSFGPIPLDTVHGKSWARVWPPLRIGGV